MLITDYIWIININIKDPTLPLKYNLDTLFIIIFMEGNKNKKISPQKVEESIAFMPFNKYLNCFNCIEKYTI